MKTKYFPLNKASSFIRYLEDKGTEFYIEFPCPFGCDKERTEETEPMNCNINPKNGRFFCMACGRQGSLKDYIRMNEPRSTKW